MKTTTGVENSARGGDSDGVERHPLLIPEIAFIVLQHAFASEVTSRSYVDSFGFAGRALRYGAVHARLSLVNRVWNCAADSHFLSSLSRHQILLSTPGSGDNRPFRLDLPPERLWPRIRRVQIFLSWTIVIKVYGDEECRREVLAFFDKSASLCDVEVVCQPLYDWRLPKVVAAALSHPALKTLEIRAPTVSWGVLGPLLESASGDRVEVLKLNVPGQTSCQILSSANFPNLRELVIGGEAKGEVQRPDPGLMNVVLARDFSRITSLTLALKPATAGNLNIELTISVRMLVELAPHLVHLRTSAHFLTSCPPGLPVLPNLASLHIECTTMLGLRPWGHFWSASGCRSLERFRLDFDDRHEQTAFFMAQQVAKDCPRLKIIEMGGGRVPISAEIVLRSIAGFNGYELVFQDEKLLPPEVAT